MLTCVNGIFASEKGSPGGGAQWLHIVTVENDPVVSQRVYVRGGDLVRSMEADIIPSLQTKHNE